MSGPDYAATVAARVEAVVFDVGRVLVEWDLRRLYAKLIDDPIRLEWFCSTVVSEDWHYQHDAGRDLAEMVAERKREFPAEADLIDAYATRFLETIPGPVAGTAALVDRLAASGIPLYAITNFASPFWAEFRPTLPVFAHFRDVVVSGDEKIAKPDARIFDLAARRFGHAPRAMLFIDDNAANIAAARALGWQVHHFESAAGLERDLTARQLI
jgi:2-haloacid dehalogenase